MVISDMTIDWNIWYQLVWTEEKLEGTYLIVVYNIWWEKIFHFDSTVLRGHDSKLFKKIFRLDVRKFCFSNPVVDNWKCLYAPCVNSGTSVKIVGYMAMPVKPLMSSLVNLVLCCMQCFCESTFALMPSQQDLSNNPDTVDDFFRLCVRYVTSYTSAHSLYDTIR